MQYRDFLKEELAKRCDRNPNYSLRAFSRSIGVDAANLSKILSEKKSLGQKQAERVLERLTLAPDKRQDFLDSVLKENVRNDTATSVKNANKKENCVKEIDVEVFRILGDWYHYAILELTQNDNFVSDIRWIGKALGISSIEAKLAIERLISVGLLEEVDDCWRKVDKQLMFNNNKVTTPALRKQAKQLLEKAIISLENDPIEQRVIQGMTMSIDESLIPEAREMIQAFTDKLCSLLESKKRQRVFTFAACLFPIQNKNREDL